MNKNLYRIVFNHALGVLQVVGEIARGASSGGSSAGGRVSATLRPLGFATWLALGWVGLIVPAVAQEIHGERQGRIASDPGAPGHHRPTVLETRNGVPLVNITTPSAAGVSRNVYSQFDVDARGAILNNARTPTQTQLAGWVDGNPWLATGTARVILNEVNSANPSYLNGYVEVAGDRAQVVIANPAGIRIDGGGFLNATRATLTTGSPIIEQGNLAGYRVEGGTIRVTGAGLDTTHVDYTDVIARSVEVNAGIWARQLQVTTGLNDVSADHAEVVARSTAASRNAPTLALDVSALGGMYAGKISLLGTEHGLGVRNAGGIGASAGELTVTVDGRLENTGSMQSRTNTRVEARGGVDNTGTLSAMRELSVTTPRDVDNSGTLNAQRIDLSAESLRNRGAIEQTGWQQLTLRAGYVTNREDGRIGLMASTGSGTGDGDAGGGTDDGSGADGDDGNNDGGGTTPPNPGSTAPEVLADGVLDIDGVLDNDGGRINAGGGVELLTATGLDNSGGYLGLQQLLLEQGELGNAGGQIAVSRDARLHVSSIDNDGGLVEVAGGLDIDADTLSNRSGTLMHGGQETASVRVSGTFDNTEGTLASNAGHLAVDAGILVNEAGRIEHAGPAGLQLTADTLIGRDGVVVTAGAAHVEIGQADHRGATLSAAQLTLEAGTFDNTGGQIVATGPAASSVSVQGAFDNGDGGRIASSGDLRIQAATFGNEGGTVQHAGTGALGIDADSLESAGGTIASNGHLALSGEKIDLRGGATTADRIVVQAGDLTTAEGTFVATGEDRLQLQVRGVLDNAGGMVATNGALELSAGSLGNHGGTIQAAGPGATGLHVAGAFDNTGGTLASAGNATIGAGALLNVGGLVQTTGNSTLAVAVEGLLDNSGDGLLASGGDTTLEAGTLDNTAGRIEHAGTGSIDIDAAVLDGAHGTIASNGALSLTGDTTGLQGGTTRAESIAIDTGTLTTAGGLLVASGDGALQLRVRDGFDNDGGTVATNGALDLVAGSFSNHDGVVQAAGSSASSVHVDGSFDNTAGTLVASGDTTVAASELLNMGGTLQAADASQLEIAVEGLLDNSSEGRIAASGDMALAAAVLDNAAGRIEHAGEGSLVVAATTLDGAGGTIASNGALSLTGENTNLRDGTTHADSISVDTGLLTTTDGSFVASGDGPMRLVLREGLVNDRGTLATNGTLDLLAGTVSNSSGVIQSAGTGPSRLQVTGRFGNDGGTVATAGDATLGAAALDNTGGTVETVGGADLQVSISGLLDNSDAGLLASAGDMDIAAATLDNSAGRIEHAGDGALLIDVQALDGAGGTVISNATLALSGGTLDLGGGETMAHRIAVDADTLVTAGGTLIASGDDALELTVRDTFDNTAGTVATNGGLQLAAGSALNRGGTIQAVGDGATAVRVQGTFDNTAGTVTTTGTTTLHAGVLTNTGGVLQAASSAVLQVTADGELLNDGGLIQGNGDIALQARALGNQGGTIATQQSIDAAVTEALDNSRGSLVAGGDLAVAAGALINRDTLDEAGERGLFGDNVTLDAASIDNTRGRIGTSESLTVDTGDLVNAGGAIDGQGEVVVTAATFDNAGGTLVQRGAGDLRVDVGGTISNVGDGLIGTEGDAIFRAGALDNTGGTVFAREGLDIASNGQLLNRDGGLLQSNAGLSVTAGGAFDNSGGALDATAAATVTASRITNIGGQLLAGQQENAGAGLTLASAGGVDNRGGTVASRGGDLQLDVASVNNRGDGVLVAGRDMALDTNAVDNAGGTVYATGNLRYENSAGVLDNAGGQFGAGNTAWLDLADIGNTSGGRIQAGTLWLTADTMDNEGGEAGADILHAQIASLTGSGRLYGAQWLDLTFSGDYTFGAGEQLESDDRLDLTVAGTFTNQGTLESAGTLNLVAGNVINHGTINASNASGTGLNSISARGTIDNRTGASIEGDTVELVAGHVTNTGDIVGDIVAIEANRFTNGRDLGTAMAARDYGEGFIGAADYLELRIGQRLSNLDGELFSGGDLVVTGRTDGSRTALLENVSGRIQAEGDVFIAADRIDNVRRVLDYEQRALTPAEQAAMTQVIGRGTSADTYGESRRQLYAQYCREDYNSHCIEFDIFQYTEIGTPIEGLFVTRASAASRLVSGGDMTLETTTLRNRHSAVAAGEDLLINGSGQSGGTGANAPGVLNESLAGEQSWDVTADYHLVYQRCRKDLNCLYEPRDVTGTIEYGQVTRMLYPEEGRATITAGNSLTIISGGDVNNAVVNVSAGLDDIGPGAVEGPGTRGLGSAGHASAGAVGAAGPVTGGSATGGSITDVRADGVAMAPGPGLEAASEWVNGAGNPLNAAPQLVGTPDRPLPGLVPADNGMFDQNADPDAPFLVTTAPRFMPDETIGSDYLVGRLGGGTNLHQRLGDNYYEQRMVLEQILQLTGRRTLDGSGALVQYRTLMDNAVDTAAQLGLELGTPLTAVQIAALDRDIVWLVEQVIDGRTVLVPVVYLSRATADRLRADGALIAAADVGIHATGTVRNDGTVSATQGMWLSADTLINDGTLDAGQRLAVSATDDVRNRGAMLAREGDVLVQAGRDFVQTPAGRLTAGGSAVVDAGRDLRLQATTVAAGDDLVLTAGRDLSVGANTQVRTDRFGYTTSTYETVQATDLQAGGNLVLQADWDVSLQAAQLQAGENVAIAAGRDLAFSTVTTTNTSLKQIDSRPLKLRVETRDETVHGTAVQAVGDITASVGRDATLTAAQVVSEQGGIAIAAGRDLTLATAKETHHFERDSVRKESGLFSSKTTTTHDEVTDTYAVGTTLSGETVDLAAGRDFTATAAQVVGTGDVSIAAVRDITIEAGQNTHTESHSSQSRKSGLFGNGGLSVTWGSRRSANTMDVAGTSHTGSMVGSLEGDTVIVAGEDVTVRGSTVASPEGDIAMYGRSVNIEEVHDTSTHRQTSRFKQSGLTLAVSVPVVEAAVAAYESSRSVGESDDSRVNAMAAANAGYDTYQAAGSATAAASSGQMVNVSLTVGSQQSSSETNGSSREVVGSSINAGGRVDITATGGGADSDIRISGSDVHGGTATSLYADDAIDILAAQNTYEQDSQNQSSGWNVGVAATGGSGGMAFGITAGVNKGQGGSDGHTVTHTSAHVGSDGTTTLSSGGTTTLRGGQVTGERVEVNADALVIESLQDTETYESRQQDASVQVTVGWGASVSGSYSQSSVDSDYASVTEQSGILAGDGGYAVNVRNNADLTGGIITSTEAAETAGHNSFSTGTLTVSELENHAEYDGSAFGISGSMGVNGSGEQGEHQAVQGSANGEAGGTSADKSFGFGRDSDSQHSVTASGINTRDITITDSVGQAATGRTVDEIQVEVLTSTTTDQLVENSGGLDNRFDATAVQKELDIQVQVTQAFDRNRQEAKDELYAHAQAKADEARAIRMANGGVDTDESTRLDEEAAELKKTAMWLDITAMAVFAGPDTSNLLTGETLTQVDLVRRTATPDAKIVLQSCEANGQNCVSREVDLDQVAVKDGKIYVFNNGIFNAEDYALVTGAKQNSNEANAQGVYYILNSYTGNPVAEVLYAGYDKLNDLMGGVLPLTGAGRANLALVEAAIELGGTVHSVNHSRGSLTWTNVMHAFDRQGWEMLPIGTVIYNGAAANAQEAADLLWDISDAGKMLQSTHATDRVGGWIGRNPATGGKDDGSLLASHSSYTGYLPPPGTPIKDVDTGNYVDLREITDRHWGEGNYSDPKEVTPTQISKEREDEGGG